MSSVEDRARELFADALRRRGLNIDATAIEGDNVFPPDEHGAAALDAIAAALREQPVQEGGGEAPDSVEFWAERLEMLADVHGCGSATMREAARLLRELATAPPSAPVGVEVVPPEAKKVEGTALGAGFVHKDDWAIPSGRCSVRIVDQRMAYGWNQCREEMLERIAQQPAQAAPGDADVRELLDAMDNGDDPRPAFIRLRKRYPHKATPPGDDAAGGG